MSDYQRDWQKYKRCRNQLWLLFASYVPVGEAVSFVYRKFPTQHDPVAAVAFLWMGLFIFKGYRLSMWPCPRCGRFFEGRFFSFFHQRAQLQVGPGPAYPPGRTPTWRDLFGRRRCAYCGLRKYQNQDTAFNDDAQASGN